MCGIVRARADSRVLREEQAPGRPILVIKKSILVAACSCPQVPESLPQSRFSCPTPLTNVGLGYNVDTVLDASYARYCPSRPLGLISLGPGVNATAQNYLGSLR